ncbi:MAG: hypothetical protein C0467_11985 [Planctomycetaceae bacterium]|nr:hypothetical protein [Planctomycetaceae bacterium]
MRIALFVAIAACAAGCADEKLKDVSGSVTHGGEPLPAGVVWFDPDPNHPGKPPQGYAYVKGGKFDTTDQGRGVRPGAYLVRVEGFDGKPGNELPLGKPLFTDHQEKQDFAAGSDKLQLEISIPKAAPPSPKADKPAKPEKLTPKAKK